MILGDAVSKLERFVWILNRITRSITWSLFIIKAPYFIKWPISTCSFMWCCQVIDKLKFETRPSSLMNFGTASWPCCQNKNYQHRKKRLASALHYPSKKRGHLAAVNRPRAVGNLQVTVNENQSSEVEDACQHSQGSEICSRQEPTPNDPYVWAPVQGDKKKTLRARAYCFTENKSTQGKSVSRSIIIFCW